MLPPSKYAVAVSRIAAILSISCSAVLGALPSVSLPSGVEEVYRFRGDLYRGSPDEIYVNRNSELATILSKSPHLSGSSDDIVVLYSSVRGTFEVDFQTNDRVLDFSFSNWGAAVSIDPVGTNPQTVYALPFGQAPEPLYQSNIGNVFINDDGIIAISSRVTNSHGMRDLWTRLPGQSVQPLPDLGEFELRGTLLVDKHGRTIQAHWMDGVIPLDSDMLRYDPTDGWDDLTLGFGEIGERPLEIVPQLTVNQMGDFVFSSLGSDSFRLNKYSGFDNSITRIYERPFVTGTVVEDLKLADNGDTLIRISKTGTQTRDIFLYRPEDGQATPFSAFIPSGTTMAGFPFMNNRGDVAFVTKSLTSGLFTAQLLRSDSHAATPLPWLMDSPLEFRNIVISDNLHPYFWLRLENEQWTLGTSIPEPTALWMILTAVVGLSISHAFTRRVQRRQNILETQTKTCLSDERVSSRI